MKRPLVFLLGLALPSAAMAQPVVAVPQTTEEITVLGRRLNSITASVTRDAKGRHHCTLSDTSGFREIDAAVCKTTTTCVRRGAADQTALADCVAIERPKLLKRYEAAVRKQKLRKGAA
jgi:hypothetical protein